MINWDEIIDKLDYAFQPIIYAKVENYMLLKHYYEMFKIYQILQLLMIYLI